MCYGKYIIDGFPFPIRSFNLNFAIKPSHNITVHSTRSKNVWVGVGFLWVFCLWFFFIAAVSVLRLGGVFSWSCNSRQCFSDVSLALPLVTNINVSLLNFVGTDNCLIQPHDTLDCIIGRGETFSSKALQSPLLAFLQERQREVVLSR